MSPRGVVGVVADYSLSPFGEGSETTTQIHRAGGRGDVGHKTGTGGERSGRRQAAMRRMAGVGGRHWGGEESPRRSRGEERRGEGDGVRMGGMAFFFNVLFVNRVFFSPFLCLSLFVFVGVVAVRWDGMP